MSQTNPGSDPIYKRLYAFAEMVEDLLRSVCPPEMLGAVDWPSLGRLPASYVSDDFRQRHGDSVWRVRLRPEDGREEWLYVLVLLEFQSTTDEIMALRVLQYTAMLYHELLRSRTVKAGELPPVLPVVLYNGDAEWRAARDVRELIADVGPSLALYQPSQHHIVLDQRRASADDMHLRRLTRAVVLLEQSRSPDDVAEVVRLLREWLGASDHGELKRAFADWLWVLWRRLEHNREEPTAPPPELTLEDVAMTLEERVISWREAAVQQGVEQGLEQGLRQGREGLQQALERERVLLRRLAEARFDANSAERLFAMLQRENDPQRLAAISDAIMRCETGEDLLRQARRPTLNAHGTARLNDVSDH